MTPEQLREILLSAARSQRPVERVAVPELAADGWDGTVWVRVIDGAERDAYELSGLASNGEVRLPRNFRARLLVYALCDSEGRRIFSDNDVEAVGKIRSDVLDRLFEAAARVNKIGAGAVEEEKKK